MAGGNGQKQKLLFLMKILLEQTDEEHPMTMEQIQEALAVYGIKAERKGIYGDIENLKQFGLDIVEARNHNHSYDYYVAGRSFEVAELKLLVDSVQSAKFITARKSQELIRKIEGLTSRYQASKLQRQVYVTERIKTINENIYYNVDQIHQAIAANRQISFYYFNWNVKKEQVLRKNGMRYRVSPWALSWDNENYYMIAYDSAEAKLKHYRVDKMLHIDLEAEAREGMKDFQRFDMGAYTKRLFGMFDGEEQIVQINAKNYLAGVFIDRFGKDVMMYPLDEENFRVNVRVAVSSQFLAWVIALGEGAKIVGPEPVLQRIDREIDRLLRQYREGE